MNTAESIEAIAQADTGSQVIALSIVLAIYAIDFVIRIFLLIYIFME